MNPGPLRERVSQKGRRHGHLGGDASRRVGRQEDLPYGVGDLGNLVGGVLGDDLQDLTVLHRLSRKPCSVSDNTLGQTRTVVSSCFERRTSSHLIT